MGPPEDQGEAAVPVAAGADAVLEQRDAADGRGLVGPEAPGVTLDAVADSLPVGLDAHVVAVARGPVHLEATGLLAGLAQRDLATDDLVGQLGQVAEVVAEVLALDRVHGHNVLLQKRRETCLTETTHCRVLQ